MKQAKQIYIGFSDLRPPRFKELMVVMAFSTRDDGHIPALFVLLTHSSESEFIEVGDYMCSELDISPQIISIPLWKELATGFRKVFPE